MNSLDPGQRQQPALPEGQAPEQVQRDRRDPDPPGEPAEHAQPEENRAELEQRCGGRVGVEH
jgi:hypothetical protein